MNQINQGESSGTPSVLMVKRKRGRPRKDPSLKNAEGAHAPPGFARMKEYFPQKADRTNGIDIMVGQPVTGVVEATFDAGYLLSVRIGNTDTNLRGVVFKPGHYIPVTAANDVAPHVEMIRRNDVHIPSENKVWSRGQKHGIQEGSIVPSKRKHSSSKVTPYVPPFGVRGNMVPVVLQPVNISNGSPASYQIPSSASQAAHMDFGDTDVHMVEPLAMLPPDRSVPVSQIFVTPQPHASHQASLGGEQNSVGSCDGGAHGSELKENGMSLKSTYSDTSSSSQPSDIQTENAKETAKSIAEDSSCVSIPELGSTTEPVSVESLQAQFASKYGTGKMTKLLMAVQDNLKDTGVRKLGASNTNSQN